MDNLGNVRDVADQNHPNVVAEAIWVAIVFFVVRWVWNLMFPMRVNQDGTVTRVNWVAVGIVAGLIVALVVLL